MIWDLPSGYVKISIEHGPLIVDLPIKNGDVPYFFVCLPEGKTVVLGYVCIYIYLYIYRVWYIMDIIYICSIRI